MNASHLHGILAPHRSRAHAYVHAFAGPAYGVLMLQAGLPVSAMQPSALRPMVPAGMHFEAEIEVNDFPQHARWKASLPYRQS